MDSQDIFSTLKTILIDEFEVDADAIRPDAKLSEDLDLDSIDAVDIILRMQEETGVSITPEDFKEVQTLADVENIINKLQQTQQQV